MFFSCVLFTSKTWRCFIYLVLSLCLCGLFSFILSSLGLPSTISSPSPKPQTISFARPQLPPDLPRGAVSLLILAQNINLPLLAARSDLASAFRWALQEDVAAQLCGAGVAFAPGQVEVRLLADSAAIPVTVTPSHGLPCHELHRLLSTKQLRWCAGSKLDHLEGFSQVCLSPSWCFFSVGLPSIVAASDELASTTAGSPLEAEGRVARASLNQD